MGQRVAIFNDTSTFHAGSRAVVEALESIVTAAGASEVLKYDRSLPFQSMDDIILPDDVGVVICNGEGTMHDDADAATWWCRQLYLAKSRGLVVGLVNTTWDGMSVKYAELLKSLDLVMVREPLSKMELAYYGVDAALAMDLSLLDPVADPPPPLPIDPERQNERLWWSRPWTRSPETWARSVGIYRHSRFDLPAGPHPQATFGAVVATLRKGSPGVYVTGQFHGFCAAVVAGIPVLPVVGNSHKVQGMVRWTGLPQPIWRSGLDIDLQIRAAVAVAPELMAWYRERVDRDAGVVRERIGVLVQSTRGGVT